MKKILNQLMFKKDFLIRMSCELGIEYETLKNYFHTDRIPEKYKPLILEAMNLTLEEDKRTKEIRVKIFENLSV